MDIPQLKLRPLHRSSLITANKTRQTPAMPKRVAGGWWPAEDDRPSARICSIGSSCASPCGRPRRTPKGAFSDKIKNSSTAIVAQRRRVASLRRRPSVCISFFGDLTSARYSVANFGGTEFRLRLLHLPGSISTDGVRETMSFFVHRRYEIGHTIGRNEFTKLWVHPILSSFVCDSAKFRIQMFSGPVSEPSQFHVMRSSQLPLHLNTNVG